MHPLAAMFDAALGLAPDWEKPAFCYAVYLDQLMVDARRRQLKAQDAQQQLLQKVLCALVIANQPTANPWARC